MAEETNELDFSSYIQYGYQQGVIETYNVMNNVVAKAEEDGLSPGEARTLMISAITDLSQRASIRGKEMMLDLITTQNEENV